MSFRVWSGLIIFAVASIALGWTIAGQQKTLDDYASRFPGVDLERLRRRNIVRPDRATFLKPIADALFFWIGRDYRYLIAYPAMLFAINTGFAMLAPNTLPGRVFACEDPVLDCLGLDRWQYGIPDWRR